MPLGCLPKHMIPSVRAQLMVRVQVQIKFSAAQCRTRCRQRRMLVSQVVGVWITNFLELRGFERLIFSLERSVSLAKGIVVLFGLIEHLLEVLYPLVLAFAISSLGSAVLGSSTLLKGIRLILSGQPLFVFTDLSRNNTRSITYRQDRWRCILIPVFSFSLRLLLQGRLLRGLIVRLQALIGAGIYIGVH